MPQGLRWPLSISIIEKGEEKDRDSGKIKFTRHSASLFVIEQLSLTHLLSISYRIGSTTAEMICSFVIKMIVKNNFIEYNQVEFQLNDDDDDEKKKKKEEGMKKVIECRQAIYLVFTHLSFVFFFSRWRS